MAENILRNKRVYKVFLSIVKYTPNILALFKILGLMLSYVGYSSFFLTCLGGTSIITLLLLYLISFIFRFCGLYRLSLNYVSIITIMSVFDFYIGLPLSTIHLFWLYAIITGVFLTSWIIYWYKHRNNPKIDHLKQLCDNICC